MTPLFDLLLSGMSLSGSESHMYLVIRLREDKCPRADIEQYNFWLFLSFHDNKLVKRDGANR